MKALLEFLKGALPWALGLALLMQLLEFWGWIASPEGKLLDFFLWIGPSVTSAPPPRIAAVNIDDEGFQQCFSFSPMDPEKIGLIVQMALDAKPRAVGVDIITDAEKLQLDYEKLPRDPRVVWAAGVQSSHEEIASFVDWITGPHLIMVHPTKVLGKEVTGDATVRWALPIYPREEDLHLRRFPRQVITPPACLRLTWPSTVAQLYRPDLSFEKDLEQKAKRGEIDELLVARVPRDLRWYKLTELFNCKPGFALRTDADGLKNLESLQNDAANQIVLIGGTFASGRDFYETPDGRISGLEMNANAITAEVAGTTLTEMPPRYRFLLDICVGLGIAFIFERKSKSVNWRIAWSLGGILIALSLAASVLYQSRLVWLSCVGIAIGMMLHVFIEIWREDLPGSEKAEH